MSDIEHQYTVKCNYCGQSGYNAKDINHIIPCHLAHNVLQKTPPVTGEIEARLLLAKELEKRSPDGKFFVPSSQLKLYDTVINAAVAVIMRAYVLDRASGDGVRVTDEMVEAAAEVIAGDTTPVSFCRDTAKIALTAALSAVSIPQENWKRPEPVEFTVFEGGNWIKWDNAPLDRKYMRHFHTIKFSDGSIFDMVNGWRPQENTTKFAYREDKCPTNHQFATRGFCIDCGKQLTLNKITTPDSKVVYACCFCFQTSPENPMKIAHDKSCPNNKIKEKA